MKKLKVGANFSKGTCEFIAWAPNQTDFSLVLPLKEELLQMKKADDGYWRLTVEGIKSGTKYFYRFNGKKQTPDPASHFQPEGVFGPSAVVDHELFSWNDNSWRGITLEEMIMYELHVGAFTKEGTFAAARERAEELAETGINAVELMPISQFPGARNWGYDAVFPYAVQNTYGDPDELKKLVQEFHSNGIAVILDVVYNHLGPEGNILKDFGPYFLSDAQTPWGSAINFDGPQNVGVRNFFLENAVHWLQNYHVDGLRLDAVYAIIDSSPKHFLMELSETVEILSAKSGRKMLLIAENDRVDPRMLKDRKQGGYGLDAAWNDNLHHAIHALLTGERNWYYAPFGAMLNVAEALSVGCRECSIEPLPANAGKGSAAEIAPNKLIVFSQNHDQIGNRPGGERLIKLAGFEAAKLAAATVILPSFTTLLFMGEEYGEDAPFLFFTDYIDKTLAGNVQVGRKEESLKNGWKENPLDSQSDSTFLSSRINWKKRQDDKSRKMLGYYKKLIGLKKNLDEYFVNGVKANFLLSEETKLLTILKQTSNFSVILVANFSDRECKYSFPGKEGEFVKMLDSADAVWGGPGSVLPAQTSFNQELSILPLSVAVYLMSKKANDGD